MKKGKIIVILCFVVFFMIGYFITPKIINTYRFNQLIIKDILKSIDFDDIKDNYIKLEEIGYKYKQPHNEKEILLEKEATSFFIQINITSETKKKVREIELLHPWEILTDETYFLCIAEKNVGIYIQYATKDNKDLINKELMSIVNKLKDIESK